MTYQQIQDTLQIGSAATESTRHDYLDLRQDYMSMGASFSN